MPKSIGMRPLISSVGVLRPMAWLHKRARTAHLHQQALKTLARGQASLGGRRKTSSGAASPGCLARSGDIKAGQTSQGSCDVSHDDRDQAGASARSVLVSSLVLRRQAPRHQAKVSLSMQRDQDQQDGRTEAIVEPKMASPPELSAGEDRFCQDSLY